jgi:cytochrome c peroxidase
MCLPKDNYGVYLLVCFAAILFSCGKESEPFFDPGFDHQVPEIVFPNDNQPDSLKIALGRKLFYDPVLSVDSTISCGSCHRQGLAFTDGESTSKGVFGRQGRRNSMSLINVAHAPYLMREGGVPTLEMQVLVPIQEHDEFAFNILEIVEKLNRIPDYVNHSLQAYGRAPDAFVITRSIAAFQRNINSFDSEFDGYLKSKSTEAISKESLLGMRLFYSDSLACGKCHHGILFTDYSFRNNGLYSEYMDIGKALLSGNQGDIGKFKVPGLRHIAHTAPYMHDGSIADLEGVIDHYASGAKGHVNQDTLIRGFHLTAFEKNALVSFLKSLSGNKVMLDTTLSNPFN